MTRFFRYYIKILIIRSEIFYSKLPNPLNWNVKARKSVIKAQNLFLSSRSTFSTDASYAFYKERFRSFYYCEVFNKLFSCLCLHKRQLTGKYLGKSHRLNGIGSFSHLKLPTFNFKRRFNVALIALKPGLQFYFFIFWL